MKGAEVLALLKDGMRLEMSSGVGVGLRWVVYGLDSHKGHVDRWHHVSKGVINSLLRRGHLKFQGSHSLTLRDHSCQAARVR